MTQRFRVIKVTKYSTNSLVQRLEFILNNELEKDWEVVSVSYGINKWHFPTALITIKKQEN